jgi:CRISPR-associated protein Cas1
MSRGVLAGTRELLNTLFVMTPGAYVRLDTENVRVEVEGKAVTQVPLHHLGGIVVFGANLVTPNLLIRCAEEGRSVTFLDANGRYRARMVGQTTGNVLLRKAQQDGCREGDKCAGVARAMVAGKLQNERAALLRAARETKSPEDSEKLRTGADLVGVLIQSLPGIRSLDDLRGREGQAANIYFDLFDRMILAQRTHFGFHARTRRPPRDRVNALLSFLYALLATDCTSALEGVGLDPQFGYLHAIRPGRPALTLDLMEEFRTPLCDRLALSLINRREIGPDAFDVRPGESVLLNDAGRKAVIVAYQKRKKMEVEHPVLNQSAPLGLFPHLQARILARHLRGDVPAYAPFVPR